MEVRTSIRAPQPSGATAYAAPPKREQTGVWTSTLERPEQGGRAPALVDLLPVHPFGSRPQMRRRSASAFARSGQAPVHLPRLLCAINGRAPCRALFRRSGE